MTVSGAWLVCIPGHRLVVSGRVVVQAWSLWVTVPGFEWNARWYVLIFLFLLVSDRGSLDWSQKEREPE